MKRRIFAFLCAFLFVVLGTACGSRAVAEPLNGDDGLRVLLLINTIGDKSVADSAHEGVRRAEKEFGLNVSVQEVSADTARLDNLMHEISSGEKYDVICTSNLGGGFMATWLDLNSAAYPKMTYILFDPPHDRINKNSNVQYIVFEQNQAGFLAGLLAAKMTQTNMIGFVGGVADNTTKDYLIGFIGGARYAKSDISIDVTFAGSWSDSDKVAENARHSISAGADVLHIVAGAGSSGALEVAAEMNIYTIGADSDQYDLYKSEKSEWVKKLLTSCEKRVDLGIYNALESIAQNKFKGGIVYYDIANEGIVLSRHQNYNQLVPQHVRSYITVLQRQLAQGVLIAPTAYELTSEEIAITIETVSPGTKLPDGFDGELQEEPITHADENSSQALVQTNPETFDESATQNIEPNIENSNPLA
ncbi:MAG: BMP family ABC transporter substrate-binding protein [Oscillospiraceae bacterium]|nr:BMP family ABC transporter substrate-binding protein [Oscillospiraceae bacterium]